ncbi:phage terminase large subunit [Asticcacaulis sp. AC402]|uniref:phage terminase large subunit n=1 Tax=Asticcacaulis sp. AC402 TaxID=1282361 RepID=UPI0003C3C124|nr:phage terminase large subunit [Asticcacaulis sp. AC402]ESQ73478.1 terminase [Asticcacaulis sp. AC402]
MKIVPLPAYRFLTDEALGHYRFRAAFGGRGGAKSWEFANAAIFHSLMTPKARVVFVREIQASLDDSSFTLVRNRLEAYGLDAIYRQANGRFHNRLNGAEILFLGLWRGNKPEGIKSLEGATLTIWEEASEGRQRSLDVLIPTVLRTPASELWCLWNPMLATDAVDRFFRGGTPPFKAVCRHINWDRNPHFPDALREQMALDRKKDPLRAAWIWDGAYMPSAQNALWTRALLDWAWVQGRDRPMEAVGRVVVGVDPAGGGGDEVGIVVAGRYGADSYMVLEDRSMAAQSPGGWATEVLRAVDAYGADCVVVERNFGGDLVASNLRVNGVTCRIREVTASRGKQVRAEPIAALYEQHKVYHRRQFAALEGQLLQMTPNGYAVRGASPDRLDALVWALTELSRRQIEFGVY